MTAPFEGAPSFPFNTANEPPKPAPSGPTVHDDLAALPQPRKHYHWYNARREANAEWMGAKQGVHDFLRAYFHVKSADWKGNSPFPLKAFSATELAKMPRYYIMDLDETMPENVAPDMPTPEEIAANTWLTDEELRSVQLRVRPHQLPGRVAFVSLANGRRSFSAELRLYSGATIDVPSMFISGKSDWGAFQRAGAPGGDARQELHRSAGHPPAGWRRALGPAGAAGESQRIAAGFSEGYSERLVFTAKAQRTQRKAREQKLMPVKQSPWRLCIPLHTNQFSRLPVSCLSFAPLR